jgi:uncharacterized membrane protein YhiD involved in acid resistance
MSIIRFRTVLKSSRDIAFVFFALATGMAAGAGNHSIAIAGVCVIGFIVLILFWIRYGQGQKELFLKFWMVPEERGEARYIALFQKYLSKYVMMNMRSAQLGQYLELSFIIQLFKQENLHRFIRDMSSLEGIERVTLVTDEKSDK